MLLIGWYLWRFLQIVNVSSDKGLTSGRIRHWVQGRHRSLPWCKFWSPTRWKNQALATSYNPRYHQSSTLSPERGNKTYADACNRNPQTQCCSPQFQRTFPLLWSHRETQLSWKEHVSQHFCMPLASVHGYLSTQESLMAAHSRICSNT